MTRITINNIERIRKEFLYNYIYL